MTLDCRHAMKHNDAPKLCKMKEAPAMPEPLMHVTVI